MVFEHGDIRADRHVIPGVDIESGAAILVPLAAEFDSLPRRIVGSVLDEIVEVTRRRIDLQLDLLDVERPDDFIQSAVGGLRLDPPQAHLVGHLLVRQVRRKARAVPPTRKSPKSEIGNLPRSWGLPMTYG